MKIDKDTIVTGITTLIGLATMIFGISRETADVLREAVPEVVGGAMAIVSVVTYLVNSRKKKTEIFRALLDNRSACPAVLAASAASDDVVMEAARKAGLV